LIVLPQRLRTDTTGWGYYGVLGHRMPTGCGCVSSVAVAPYDSDDDALEAYERDVLDRAPADSEFPEMPTEPNQPCTVDAYGFEIQLTPEQERARLRTEASAARRAPRWQVYRADLTDVKVRDFRSRRLEDKKSVDANLTALIRKGVPRDLRGRTWMQCSGAASRKENAPTGHYQSVVANAEKALKEVSEKEKESGKKDAKKKDEKKKDNKDKNKKGEDDEKQVDESQAQTEPSFGQILKPFAQQIDLDISRTFPENARYHGGEGNSGDNTRANSTKETGGREQVRRVLLAYAAEHPHMGYCQGMNYVAAFIWLAVGRGGDGTGDVDAVREATIDTHTDSSLNTPTTSEETTYWLFTSLLDDVLAPEIYARDVFGTLREFRVLQYLLAKYAPSVNKHFRKNDIDLVMLQSKWMLCVLTESFPSATSARVFDVLFAEGSKVWFRVVLGVLSRHSGTLREQNGLPEVMNGLVEVFRNQHDADGLLKYSFSKLKFFSRKTVDTLRTRATAELKEEKETERARLEKRREERDAKKERQGKK
tara:strand:- start:6799 stop:8409 length:1611 start_codon:yes stop_codon:yes gene_type:complete